MNFDFWTYSLAGFVLVVILLTYVRLRAAQMLRYAPLIVTAVSGVSGSLAFWSLSKKIQPYAIGVYEAEVKDGELYISNSVNERTILWPVSIERFELKFVREKIGGAISVHGAGAGAFLIEDTSEVYQKDGKPGERFILNGKELNSGDKWQLNDSGFLLSFSEKKSFAGRDSVQFAVSGSDLATVATASVNLPGNKDYIVLSLSRLFKKTTYQKGVKATQVVKIESALSGENILIRKDGSIWMCEKGGVFTLRNELDANLEVSSPSEKVYLGVTARNDQGIKVILSPPWRRFSQVDNLSSEFNARGELFGNEEGDASVVEIDWDGGRPKLNGEEIEYSGENLGIRATTIAERLVDRVLVSRAQVDGDSGFGIGVGIVASKPNFTFLVLAVLFVGLFLSLQVYAKSSNWVLTEHWSSGAGNVIYLGSIVHALLFLRFLFSIRLGCEYAFLDWLSLKGGVSSAIGMLIVPFTIISMAEFQLSHYSFVKRSDKPSRIFRKRIGYSLGALAVVSITISLFQKSYSFWGVGYSEILSRNSQIIGISIFVLIFFAGRTILHRILSQRNRDWTGRVGMLMRICASPVKVLLLGSGRLSDDVTIRFWNILRMGRERGEEVSSYFTMRLFIVPVIIVILVSISAIFAYLGLKEAVQLYLLVLFGSCVVGLSGLGKNVSSVSGLITHWIVMVFFISVIFLIPIFIGDSGSIYAGLGFVVALTIALFLRSKAENLKWLMGPIVFLVLGVVFLFKVPDLLEGRAFARISLVSHPETKDFRVVHGDEYQTDGERFVSAVDLENSSSHIEQSKLCAAAGGFSGRGVFESPVRFSGIPQDTIQFDSFVTFFLLAEGGFFALGCLFVGLTVPCVILISVAGAEGRKGGYLASIIFIYLVSEILCNVLMNIGVIPFTGRPLALLTPGSNGDLFKWLLAFGFVGEMLVWHLKTPSETFSDNIVDH